MITNEDMIINRTQKDVDEARRIISEKIQFDPTTLQPVNDEELTHEEEISLQKGTFNTSDLNRIENKQSELKNLFNNMGYWNNDITTKIDWSDNDVFLEIDFLRIIDNLNVLRNSFFTYIDTPVTPPVSFHYEDINAIEKILVDLDVMINDVKSKYRRCGTFRCGG